MGIASSPYTERRRSVRGPRMLGALGLEGMKKTLSLSVLFLIFEWKEEM